MLYFVKLLFSILLSQKVYLKNTCLCKGLLKKIMTKGERTLRQKKLFCAVLALIMAVSMIPLYAFAEANDEKTQAQNVISVPEEALFYESTSGGVKISGIRKDWFQENCPDNSKDNLAYFSLTIPAVNSSGSKVVSIGSNAFCTNKANYDANDRYNYIHPSNYKIVNVDFSQASNLSKIESQAFMRNDQLTGPLTLPISLTTLEKSAFNSCTSLKGIYLPSGLEEIGNSSGGSVFLGCSALEFVRVFGGDSQKVFELPSSLKSIGKDAFKQCFASSVQTAVNIPASVTFIGEDAFKNASLGYLPITAIIVEADDASGYAGGAFEAANTNEYGLESRMTIFKNSEAFHSFKPSGFTAYKNSLTYEFTLQFGNDDGAYTEQKLYNQTPKYTKDEKTGKWKIDENYVLPQVPPISAQVGYTGGWVYNDEIFSVDTKLMPSGDLLIVEVGEVLSKPTVVPIIDGKAIDFTDTSFDINVSNDKEHQIGVLVTHPLTETTDSEGGSVYFKYEWTDVWKGGSEGPRMSEDGFGFPSFPSRGTPTISIDGPEHERTTSSDYSGEDYGDGYYLVEIYGYYSRPGKAAELFYKSRHTKIGISDPDATEDHAYIFYVKTSDPAQAPDVNLSDVAVEYGYDAATFSAEVAEQPAHTYTYQWYEADEEGQTQNGKIIEGANAKEYTVQSGKDAGTYYYYLKVSAVKAENGDAATISVPVKLTIAPKTITVTPDANQHKYTGQNDPTFTYTLSYSSEEIGLSGELNRIVGEEAQSYAFTLGSLAAKNPNYKLILDENSPKFEIRIYSTKAIFSPDVPDGENGWYQSQVTVAPPEGHKISLDGKSWNDGPIVFDAHEGEFTYYLKSVKEDDTKDAIAKNTTDLFVDTISPAIIGVEDSKVYCISAAFDVTEENLAEILVDGVFVDVENLPYTLLAGEHEIIAKDKAGNSTTVHITVNKTHTDGELIVDTAPTCTTPGSGHKECILCGQLSQKDIVIDAFGHEFEKWNFNAEEHFRKCGVCSFTEHFAHEFGDWSILEEPSAEQKGLKQRICTVCGYKELVELPKESPSMPADNGESDSSSSNSPRTADDSNIESMFVLAVIALFGIVMLSIYKKKRRAR